MPSFVPTLAPPPACFDLVLTDSFGDGFNGAYYNITFLDGDDLAAPTTIASGTLLDGFNQTDTICVDEYPACYGLVVTGGRYPKEITWSLGDGALSGGAPTSAEFIVLDGGVVLEGTCTTAPTIS